MGATTVQTGGAGTTVVVRGGSTTRVTLDRRTVASIANNQAQTTVERADTPVQVAQRDTLVRTGSAMGVQGAPGLPSAPITAVAGTDLTYPRVVKVVAGVATYADPAIDSDMTAQLAITLQGVAASALVQLMLRGAHTESAWGWTPGRVYLALTGGGLTQTPAATGAILEVGRAISATTIEFDIQPALLR